MRWRALRADSRGRLTPVDVVLFAATLAALAFLVGPMMIALDDNAYRLSTPTAFLFQMVPAGLVATVLIIIWRTSVGGGS